MTVELDDEVTDIESDEPVPAGRPAGWWARAAALAVDVLAPVGALAAVLLVIGAWLDWPPLWIGVLLAAASLVVIAVTRWLLPNLSGWSLGRSLFGIAVVDAADGGSPGPGRLALRDLAHVIDTVPFALGWFWPLLDNRGRTFADMVVHTEVREVDGPIPDRRRIATAVLAASAAVAVVAAGLGYALVFRNQQSLSQARAQIADEGPTLVEEMLSYTAKTAQDDFAHAQTLVTDGYRPELIQQQEAVKKAGLVDNDYWVSNSAVLSSSRDRATMLLMLQGQRGVPPKQRFVTASLRVDYEKIGEAWKVANLTVLTAPKPPPAPAQPEPAKSEAPKSPAPKSPAPKSPAPKSEAPKPQPKPGTGGR